MKRTSATILAALLALCSLGQVTTLPNGNVGIGIANPIVKLHVVIPVSTSNFSGDPNSYGVAITDNVNSTLAIRSLGNGTIHLASDFPGRKLVFGGGTFEQTLSVNAGRLVGIGTLNPRSMLDIWGGMISVTGSDQNGTALVTASSGTAYFCNNSLGNGLAIAPSGNVLIGNVTGTGKDSYLLNVAGFVRANKLTVNTTGADFVFEPSYKLKPLSEVEIFIRQNHRLPGIAPAAEMQKNGIEIGEQQAKLLQKVEELTLYVIAQEKKQESQNKRMEQQGNIIVGQGKLLETQQDMLLQFKKELTELKQP